MIETSENPSISIALSLANKYKNNDDYQMAMNHYREILAFDDTHAEASYNMGLIETHSNNLKEAIGWFDVAINNNPECEQYWLSYINCLIKSRQLELASLVLNKAESIISGDVFKAFSGEIVALESDDKGEINSSVRPNANVSIKPVKFLIMAPPYTEKSCGIVVLHELCDQLNKAGYQAAIFLFGPEYNKNGVKSEYFGPNLLRHEITTDNEFATFKNEGVVIYPEIISGNPISAKHVVRYMLNSDGFVYGNKVQASKNDFILAYSPVYHDNPHAILSNEKLNPLFNADGVQAAIERTIDLTYYGKAESQQDCFVVPNSIKVMRHWPQTKAELALLLRNTRYLYTWDHRSALITEAIFCGAIPVFLNSEQLHPFPTSDASEVSTKIGTTLTMVDDMPHIHQPDDLNERINRYKKNYLSNLNRFETDTESVVKLIFNHFNLH